MLSKIPEGYKVAFENRSDRGSILEMIPEREALSRWTEMLTVQIIRNTGGWTVSGFQKGMTEQWTDMCPCGSTEIIECGYEQFQPRMIWSHACPLNKNTGKPENAWFKVAIRNGNLIVVQKAFRFEPSADAIAFWIAFLKALRVDDRL